MNDYISDKVAKFLNPLIDRDLYDEVIKTYSFKELDMRHIKSGEFAEIICNIIEDVEIIEEHDIKVCFKYNDIYSVIAVKVDNDEKTNNLSYITFDDFDSAIEWYEHLEPSYEIDCDTSEDIYNKIEDFTDDIERLIRYGREKTLISEYPLNELNMHLIDYGEFSTIISRLLYDYCDIEDEMCDDTKICYSLSDAVVVIDYSIDTKNYKVTLRGEIFDNIDNATEWYNKLS